MKKINKFKALAFAIAGLTTTHVAQAITPWQANDANASNYATPDFVVYTSGGAAQDLAYQQVVLDVLAKAGTADIFQDKLTGSSNGSRFTGFYFIGASTLTDPNLRGKKIYLEKRSLGAAGYGVVPLLANLNIDHLNIFQSATSLALSGWTNTTPNINIKGVQTPTGTHVSSADITAANASSYLISTKSHGGFSGVDAAALLKTATENYPDAVKEVSTGALTAGWSKSYKAKDLASLTRIPTGGLVYGIGVTLDFYKVLQAAQKATGSLPSSTVIGAYDQASLPSLSRNFLAALLSGNIQHWSNVEIVDKTTGLAKPLNDASILTAAGVSAPSTDKVAVGRRNTGAAIGAVAYAKLLNYPYAESAVGPAVTTASSSAAESASAPVVKAPTGASGTEVLLLDWQNGTNNSGLNNVTSAKYWGFAINSADRNTDVTAAGVNGAKGKDWRYIKIDGYAPTIENVASGNYPYWAEGEVLISKTYGTADEVSLFTDFANALSTTAIAAQVDTALIQPWGQTGIFATTVTDSNTAIDVPFVANHPIVPLTHLAGDGYTHLGVVPYPYDNFVAGPTGNAATGSFIELQ